ncbi:baseplate assembly protein [Leptospira andrefontaineae]|uniref:Baseplate assembly protein n=1 Tax=Leptospira andrefontaineae TaxID=2484976 RepID=A0A4R9H6L0_9LEPT|nr:baseplate assembly protein [Leptospira andrefontaineae]TGK41233.1 baseplate assembly protein [Leptospira andrefontaineae]
MNMFSNDEEYLQTHPSSIDDIQTPPTLAMVTDILPRFKANILTADGVEFRNVRYFGPYISENTAHGRAFGIKKNQIVLVEFIGGSFRAPIISKMYPFAALDRELNNLSGFWKKYSFIDPETDIIDFHESGYFIRQTTNKIQVFDQEQNLISEVDFSEKKISWKIDRIEIESNISIKGDLTIKGNTNQTGDIHVTGELSATDEISSDMDVKAGQISLMTHPHQYNPGPLPPAPTGPPEASL